MTSIDYSVFTKNRLTIDDFSSVAFDVFISSFNSSERVQTLFHNAAADRKVWLVHPEYGYAEAELPTGGEMVSTSIAISPVEFWHDVFDAINLRSSPNQRLAVDITGMMRPHLMLLPLMLRVYGVDKVTVFYSDPKSYASGDETKFSKGPVENISIVPGMEGAHQSATIARDVLIIGAGYDEALVRSVAEHKRSAEHFLLLGLPSLQPHMYQESILRISGARESIRDFRNRSFLFAPANDPFMTAQVLSDHVSKMRDIGRADNIYLCPVGPKTQVLGFSWFFLCEARHSSVSMLFPVSSQYNRETSKGISAIHRFDLELDMIM